MEQNITSNIVTPPLLSTSSDNQENSSSLTTPPASPPQTSSNATTNRKAVKIVSNEGDEYDLEDCVVEMCRTVKYIASGKLGFRNGLGGWFNIEGKYVLHKKEGRLLATIYTNNETECILCFPEIRGQILSTIIDYCKFHSSNPSPQQIAEHDESLISMKQSSLCELASASYYLDVKSLVSLTSREIAAQISQKSSEEIRETFTNLHLAGYNQFFSSSKCTHKKLKKEKLQITAPTTPIVDDNRSVDELLAFLGEGESKKKKSSTKSKKSNNNNKKSSTTPISTPKLIVNNNNNNNNNIKKLKPIDQIENLEEQKIIIIEPLEEEEEEQKLYNQNLNEEEEEEEEEWDEIDPDLQEEIDKEVESFKQRLDLFSQQSKQKLILPSRTLEALNCHGFITSSV